MKTLYKIIVRENRLKKKLIKLMTRGFDFFVKCFFYNQKNKRKKTILNRKFKNIYEIIRFYIVFVCYPIYFFFDLE